MTSIYVIASSPHGPCKIGYSKVPEKRLRQLQTGHSETLSLYHAEPVGERARLMEGLIHADNRHRKLHGEWYRLTVEEAIIEVRHAVIRYEGSADIRQRLKF